MGLGGARRGEGFTVGGRQGDVKQGPGRAFREAGERPGHGPGRVCCVAARRTWQELGVRQELKAQGFGRPRGQVCGGGV